MVMFGCDVKRGEWGVSTMMVLWAQRMNSMCIEKHVVQSE